VVVTTSPSERPLRIHHVLYIAHEFFVVAPNTGVPVEECGWFPDVVGPQSRPRRVSMTWLEFNFGEECRLRTHNPWTLSLPIESVVVVSCSGRAA
jgi:hypothetical protein